MRSCTCGCSLGGSSGIQHLWHCTSIIGQHGWRGVPLLPAQGNRATSVITAGIMGLCLLLNELDMKRRRQWNQSYSNKEVALESERYGYVFIHCKEECSDCSAGKAP